MAGKALKRLDFDDRTIELVRFIIREHLLMPHITQRRDMDDDDTISGFIARIRSVGRLKMLTLITFADLAALSSDALNEWKKALLLRLFYKANILIEKGYEQSVISEEKDNIGKFTEILKGSFPESVIINHIKNMPEQYARFTPALYVRDHLRSIEQMRLYGIWATFRHRGDHTLLTIVTPDYPKALSDICGVITSSGINIVGARIFTRKDGIIIDTFLVVDEEGYPVIPLESQKLFKKSIADMIARQVKVADLIENYRRRWKRRRKNRVYSPARIRFDNEISSRYTVIDIFANDYIGLLYDITSIFAANDLNIISARIGTDEDQVADAFYVEKRGGGKIENPDELQKLTDKILGRIKEFSG